MPAASATAPRISDEQVRQFHAEGYFILERILPDELLDILRRECDAGVAEMDAQMQRDNATTLGITHYRKRYFIGNRTQKSADLRRVFFSELYADICRATIGPEAYLFCEQFVVKCGPEPSSKFSWHQDSGYVGHEHRPYLTCWTAIDDATVANGTIYVLPYSRAGTRDIIQHKQDPTSNDLVGYHGDDPGIPVEIPAGSIAVFSSRTFHRSGPNTTDRLRRAQVPQFSPEPILVADGSKLWNMAVPFLRDGKIIADPDAVPRPAGESVR